VGHSLTISELDPATTDWINQEAQRSGTSAEVVARRLFYRGLEIEQKQADQQLQHDLDALAGTWSAEEAAEFLQATAGFDQIDPALWQ
jgi:hypothetical protein